MNRKNIIVFIVIIVITNLITYFTFAGNRIGLSIKKGEETVAKVDGLTYSADDLYESWKISSSGSNAITTLLNDIDTFILNEKYGDDEEMQEDVAVEIEQTYAYYESQGTNLDELFESGGAGLSKEEFDDSIKLDFYKNQEAIAYLKSIVTDDEVETAHANDIPQYRTSHILVKVTEDPEVAVEEAMSDAQETAEEILAELDKAMTDSDDKEATFAEFAKEYSEDEDSKENGGDIGFSSGEDAAYDAAAQNLEVGEYTSEVIETAYGYSIIMKTDVEEPKDLEDEDVVNTYKEQVAEEKLTTNQSYIEYALIELRAEYNLDIKDKQLKEEYDTQVESVEEAITPAEEDDE